MVTAPAAGALRDARRTFLRCRRRAFAASGATGLALAVLAALLLAPNQLASLRLGDMALAWWVAGAVVLAGLLALGRVLRGAARAGDPAGTARFSPLALAVVRGSPALWLGIPPLLLADGTRGLWAPAVVVGGSTVALLLLGTPSSRTPGLVVTPSMLTRSRWPAARGCQAFLGSIETAVAGLFVWTQLAAAREIGSMAGWPGAATVGLTLLLLGALLLPDLVQVRLTALGGGLALAGLAVPLAVVALGTATDWPNVWTAVASRVRIAFGQASYWTAEGQAVRGPSATAILTFADEQRVTFGGRASVFIEPLEGGRLARDVEAGEEVALHAGDRLVVPDGLRLRFEVGRRIPGAPDSGPEWVEPPSRVGWLWLMAVGVTGFFGTLGLPAGAATVGPGRASSAWSTWLAAVLVASGVALAVGWALYAAWLTPEVYIGGVTGAEVYALPARMPAAGPSGRLLAWLVSGGLAAGGVAAALGALRGLPVGRREVAAGRTRRLAIVLVMCVGLLAGLCPIGAWTLLVATLGLAASALAPAAVLATWSERVTARGAAVGAGAGLAVFVLAGVGGVWSPGGLGEGGGVTAAAAAAAIAAPAHLLVAWLLRTRRAPTSRTPLPPGLEGLSVSLSAGPRAG